MRIYDVIEPPNEEELGKRLAANGKLTGAVLKLIVVCNDSGDELAARRGNAVKKKKFTFCPATLDLQPPTTITGDVYDETGETYIGYGGIRAKSGYDNDAKNPLQFMITEGPDDQ